MSEYKIRDESIRRYYTQIPNIVDDMGLSVYAFRLYVHLKRVAGEEGSCWQSTETLAVSCGMSMAMISKVKDELIKFDLITITPEKTKGGGRASHIIEIIDIWPKNEKYYQDKKVATSSHEVATSHREVKNNPLKNNPNTTEAKASVEQPEKKPRNAKDPALEIQSTLEGKVLWEELEYAFRSKGRSAPTYYATPQQRDAYQAVFAKLKDQLKPLIKKGFSRGIVSLDRLLAWLESCAVNSNSKRPVNGSKGPVPGTLEYYGMTKEPPKGTPEHDAWAVEQTRISNELYHKYNP